MYLGWSSIVGDWSRVEGTPDDPNPNKPFAKIENNPLFNSAGYTIFYILIVSNQGMCSASSPLKVLLKHVKKLNILIKKEYKVFWMKIEYAVRSKNHQIRRQNLRNI